MPYQKLRGRRPFERASKIAHSDIVGNPVVQQFVNSCVLPAPPAPESLESRLVDLPKMNGQIKTVIAIDGGMNEAPVREEYPSASIAFVTMGPLLLNVADLEQVDREPFIGPEDMQRLKKIQRYNLVVPIRAVLAPGAKTFAAGVRKSIHDFLSQGDGHLLKGLAWLLHRGWSSGEKADWEVPRCPVVGCDGGAVTFKWEGPTIQQCAKCGTDVYLADGLRLYERIDEETGAGGVMSYLLTGLEQVVLVHLIRSVWYLKPDLLKEVLFVKDGPLAFFGVTAPLYKPMNELMEFLRTHKGGPYINLVGLEKSGPFVEHAALIEAKLGKDRLLLLDSEYIYKHILPGNPDEKDFGKNTYYGAKVILKGVRNDVYVATVPTGSYKRRPTYSDLINATEVLGTTLKLRCSMYDNALVPVVLANRLVSLADVPSSEILKRFAKERLGQGT